MASASGDGGSGDEERATFFVERVCPEADHAYRLGFALTLSREGASRCVMGVFKKLAPECASLTGLSSEDLRKKVLRMAWEEFHSMRDKYAAEATSIAKFFASLSLEGRAALVIVDVCGMTAAECGEIMAQGAPQVTGHVSVARRELVKQLGTDVKRSLLEEADNGPEDA